MIEHLLTAVPGLYFLWAIFGVVLFVGRRFKSPYYAYPIATIVGVALVVLYNWFWYSTSMSFIDALGSAMTLENSPE